MSYEIVKSIKIIPEKIEIRINSAPNNVRPLKYYSNKQIATTEEKFRENILYLLKDIDGGELALSNNKENSKENKDYFKINPKQQDNNNGILIIDIQDNGKIKYGFAVGYEGETKDDAFNIISARKYGVAYQDCANEKDMFVAEQQVKFIDNNFELLTQADYNEIFNQEYYYKDCLEKKE